MHRLLALVDEPSLDELAQRAHDRGLIGRRHRQVRVVPVAEDAQSLEVVALRCRRTSSRTRGRRGGTPTGDRSLAGARRAPSRRSARSAGRGSPSPATYGASNPAIDRDLTTRSFRILFSAWPMWIWPLAYGRAVVQHERRAAACARSRMRLVQAHRVPAGDRGRLGRRQVRLHREVGPRQIERVFPVAHGDDRNPHSIIEPVAAPLPSSSTSISR